ncbi:MAG: c-type cytochrome domain-containing protein, partial [Pirellulaceae bacterium]
MIRFPTQGDVPSMLRLLAFWSCLFLLPLGMTPATAQEASQAAESQAAAENESKALDDPSASAPSEQSTPEQSTPEQAAPEQATGPQVRFHRDVLPIFQKRCQSCHGAEDAKADFRIDDRDAVLGYIEPGDAEASSLWTDYLTADPDAEESQLMPPVSEEPLTMAELATIRWWIEQGAEWPESLGVPEEEGPK